MTNDLVAYVRSKVLARRGDWPRLAKELGVSYSWLAKFANDYPHDVGHRRLQQVAAHFQAAEQPESVA